MSDVYVKTRYIIDTDVRGAIIVLMQQLTEDIASSRLKLRPIQGMMGTITGFCCTFQLDFEREGSKITMLVNPIVNPVEITDEK